MKSAFWSILACWMALAISGVSWAGEPAPGEVKNLNGAMVLTADTPWVISADEPEAMQRALTDVKNRLV